MTHSEMNQIRFDIHKKLKPGSQSAVRELSSFFPVRSDISAEMTSSIIEEKTKKRKMTDWDTSF